MRSKKIKRSARKAAVFVAGMLGRVLVLYAAIGLWNRVFGGWRSVFFCYSGGARYSDVYAPGRFAQLYRWRPSPIGVLRQGCGLGLVLGSIVTEAEFMDPANAADFERLQRRLRLIARLMGVRQVHLAGILPGVLRDGAVVTPHPTREITAQIVTSAVQALMAQVFDGGRVPVILLGGAGYLGRAVAPMLQASGLEAHVVDPAAAGRGAAFPAGLRGAPALLVDLARRGALQQHLDQLWPGLVVLNEVFPEPGRHLAEALAHRGISLWHIAGAPGQVWPKLPGGYATAVPCCAVHDGAGDLAPILVALNAP